MKHSLLGLLFSLSTALSFGQAISLPNPFPVPQFVELKTYLNLTDAQVLSLQGILSSRTEASNVLSNQITEKYTELDRLQQSDVATATQLGQILLDIRELQKRLPLVELPYKTQAFAVLTPEQKNKLPTLAQALLLQTPAWQAVSMLLIDYPYNGGHSLPLSGMMVNSAAAVGAVLSMTGAAIVRQ